MGCRDYFISIKRRHTRCAEVTGVQTCALPISAQLCTDLGAHKNRALRCDSADAHALQMTITSDAGEHDGIEVLDNNAGAGVFRSIEELTRADIGRAHV